MFSVDGCEQEVPADIPHPAEGFYCTPGGASLKWMSREVLPAEQLIC